MPRFNAGRVIIAGRVDLFGQRITYELRINPNVAKVGGLQSQGVKGEIVVGYLDPLTTQDLKSSGFPVG